MEATRSLSEPSLTPNRKSDRKALKPFLEGKGGKKAKRAKSKSVAKPETPPAPQVPIEVSRITEPPLLDKSAETFENSILMPPNIPHPVPDTYHCISQRAPPNISHMVAYRPLDDEGHIHHLILFACEEPWQPKEGEYWDCLALPVCKSRSLLAYAWALRAPPLTLPDDIGFVVGGNTVAKYFVLQIHFKNPSPGVPVPVGLHITLKPGTPEKYVGMMLMIGINFNIPPKIPEYHVTLSCDFNYAEDVHFFAYRTHAHYLGREITGTLTHDSQNSTIALRSAQQPQTFLMMDKAIDVRTGDRLTADCKYDSMKKNTPTGVGSRSTDEMCNLYFMFWTETPSQASLTCVGRGEARFDDFHSALDGATSANVWEADELQLVKSPELQLPRDTQLVSVQPSTDYLLMFHRGGRVWDQSTFTANHLLNVPSPIDRAVLSFVSRAEGKLVSQWGEQLFYLPHGFFIDNENNMWFTDCGSHQVLKFVNFELALVLGTKLQPGADAQHFCKPADVLVHNDNSIYVADGYCNSRLVHFAPNGAYLDEVALPAPRGGAPALPHSITLNKETGDIFVADRENGRILRVSQGTVSELAQLLQSKVYALAFKSEGGGVLAAVTHTRDEKHSSLEIFTLKANKRVLGGAELLRVRDGVRKFEGLYLHHISIVTTERQDGSVAFEYFMGGKEADSDKAPVLVHVAHNFTNTPMPISTLAGVAMEAGSHVGVVD